MTDHAAILARLESVIARRSTGDPQDSYVARLHARGIGKMAQKLGEEATETVIAALTGSAEDLTGEAADLVFHLLVLLGARGVAIEAVLAELERREGTSGIVEKASRSA
jgi:phosphoribosyl-ATP pyrophosphohydrolase